MERNGKPVVVPFNGGRKMLVLGNEIEVKLDSSATAGALFAFENTIQPGEGVPPHIHTREDEVIHLVEGECEIFIDGKTYNATAGAVVNFPRNVIHAFRNVGKVQARALFIVTPGENFEAFFEELSVTAPTMPADMEKVTAVFAKYGLPITSPVSVA